MASEIRLTDSAARLSLQHQDITYLAGLCPAAKGICSPEHNPHLFQRNRCEPSAACQALCWGLHLPSTVNSQNNLVPFPVLQMKKQTSKL